MIHAASYRDRGLYVERTGSGRPGRGGGTCYVRRDRAGGGTGQDGRGGREPVAWRGPGQGDRRLNVEDWEHGQAWAEWGMYGKRVRKNDQAVGGWVGKRQKVRGRKKWGRPRTARRDTPSPINRSDRPGGGGLPKEDREEWSLHDGRGRPQTVATEGPWIRRDPWCMGEGGGGRGMRESQSPDEQLICVRLCKVVQSLWILQSIQYVSLNDQFSGVPLWVSGICYNALSERQSKSSNNLRYNAYTKTCYHSQRRYLGCKLLTAWTKKWQKITNFRPNAHQMSRLKSPLNPMTGTVSFRLQIWSPLKD